jgi:hypothetical protein
VVINIEAQTASLGNCEQLSALNAAIQVAIAKGCVVCVAAGNGGRDAGIGMTDPQSANRLDPCRRNRL